VVVVKVALRSLWRWLWLVIYGWLAGGGEVAEIGSRVSLKVEPNGPSLAMRLK
jgi:hypothetical protein